MKNKILLSTLLLASVVALGTSPSFAATSANQTVTGVLGLRKEVQNKSTAILANIDAETGALSSALTPAFDIITNTSNSQTLDFKGTCGGGSQACFYDRGGTRYIVLANTTVVPTDAEIQDCGATTPVATANSNAISYLVSEPATPTGLAKSWIPGALNFGQWQLTLTKKGTVSTNVSAASGATPYTGTYSGDDEQGDYKANVVLSFNP